VPIPHAKYCTGPCKRKYGEGEEECHYDKGHTAEVAACRKEKEEKKRRRDQEKERERIERTEKKQKLDEEKDKKAKERARILQKKAKARAPHNRRFSSCLAAKGIPPGNSPAYLMKITEEVNKWNGTNVYKPGVTFDPDVADEVHQILVTRQSSQATHQEVKATNEACDESPSEQRQSLQKIRTEKQEQIAQLRNEVATLSRQIDNLDQAIGKAKVLKRASSF